MNKKLLLVSLLSVGMLVGCGGGDNPTVKPSEDPVPPTEDNGGGEKPSWTGKFGNAGYYLVGDFNGWNNFWKFSGFEDFEFTKVSDTEYTLNFSITEELLASEAMKEGDFADALDFKVMQWDGNKAPTTWLPDGVKNNGKIDAAGEYKFTFNPSSKEQGTNLDGDPFTLYTKAERVGDVKAENSFVKGEARQFEPIFDNVTYKVAVEEGLTIPEGYAVYLHTWGLQDKDGNDVSGYFETKLNASGVWEYTTEVPVTVDDGTGAPLTYGFCLIVDETGKTEQNWDRKISNSATSDGNYSIEVSAKKTKGTELLKKADKPYWTKGEVYNPYTVEEVINLMKAEDYVEYTEYTVTGEVTKASYNSRFKSWDLWLKVPTAEETPAPTAEGETPAEPTEPVAPAEVIEFQVYSGKLNENMPDPEVGDTIVATGKSKIFKKDNKVVYEIAYDGSHKVSPQILDVQKGELFYLYVRGSLTEWGCKPTHKLVSTAKNVYSVTIEIAEGDEFKLSNNTESWDVQFGGAKAKAQLTIAEDIAANFDATGDNIKCLTAGTYTFTYDLTGETPVTTLTK